jgi:TonB family protein
LLSRETSFKQNRFFLLAGLLFSLFIPFVQFPLPVEYQPEVLIRLKTVDIFGSGKPVRTSGSFFSVDKLIKIVYFCGVLFLVFKFLSHLRVISKFRNNSRIIKNRYGKVVYTGKQHPVFSFLNSIFIDVETENSKELNVILAHESVHIVQMHSIDLLLFEVLAIVQWFNPMVWLYLRSIKQNHEYLADQGVIKNGFAPDTYQKVLLYKYSALRFDFANSFNHSLTLKRLIMMKKINSKNFSAFKLMIIILVVLATVYFVSCSNNTKNDSALQSDSNKAKTALEDVAPPPPPPPPPIDSIDVIESFHLKDKPEFPGGDEMLIKYVVDNIVYPIEAKEKGIMGTVYVRFVVTKSGNVAYAKVLRKVNPLLEAEAIRVVSSMPTWKPGMKDGQPVNVWFIIPVKFKLN